MALPNRGGLLVPGPGFAPLRLLGGGFVCFFLRPIGNDEGFLAVLAADLFAAKVGVEVVDFVTVRAGGVNEHKVTP
jgi:hypothetical protein